MSDLRIFSFPILAQAMNYFFYLFVNTFWHCSSKILVLIDPRKGFSFL